MTLEEARKVKAGDTLLYPLTGEYLTVEAIILAPTPDFPQARFPLFVLGERIVTYTLLHHIHRQVKKILQIKTA